MSSRRCQDRGASIGSARSTSPGCAASPWSLPIAARIVKSQEAEVSGSRGQSWSQSLARTRSPSSPPLRFSRVCKTGSPSAFGSHRTVATDGRSMSSRKEGRCNSTTFSAMGFSSAGSP